MTRDDDTTGRYRTHAQTRKVPRDVSRFWSSPSRGQVWVGAAVMLGVTFWVLGPIMAPFIVGAVIAYFLNPFVCWLDAHGIRRTFGAAVLVLLLMVLMLAALVVLLPIIAFELTSLIRSIPDQYAAAQAKIAELFPALTPREADDALDNLLNRVGERMAESDLAVMDSVISGFGSVVQAILFWVVMPVVAFYLLLDWERLVRAVENLIPRANLDTVRRLACDCDLVLAGYVRGTTTVCMILAVYYAVCLGVTGLSYGFLIGIIAGLISFIPYVGAFIGGSLSIGIALGQFWDEPIFIAIVVGIFLFGQVLESQILVPRLVGASVNLHPVWLIFAIIALGYLFGFMGAIAAVPLAGCLGVLFRALYAEYTRTALYAPVTLPQGRDTEDAPVPCLPGT